MKKAKVLPILALAVIVGVFLFFSRLHHNDVKALTDFAASYKNSIKQFQIFRSVRATIYRAKLAMLLSN